MGIELLRSIEEHLKDPQSHKGLALLVEQGLKSLPALCEMLRRDLPIEQTERLEALLKAVLHEAMKRPLPGADARRIAQFQKELGFILKYKSYAIKAAAPVGYSIFLQKEGEGFSFQRHVVHKLEVFHILRVKPGGYIFLCDFADWKRIYRKDSFERWLNGAADPDYERYRFVPEPGDVFIISELGVVHTVIGCVLEEYATVSTDMVDRLHDQNIGKKIPAAFDRAHAEPELRAVETPVKHRLVTGLGDKKFEHLKPARVQGGERVVLCDSFVTAARYRIDAGKESAFMHDDTRAILLRMNAGRGTVVIADAAECAAGKLPGLQFERGDLVLIPPGIRYAVQSEGEGPATYSEHCIAPDVAFI